MGKTIMNRITLTLATVLSLAFTQVTAQDYNKGYNAYKDGDYATALKEWKPLAEQGDAAAQRNLGFMYKGGNGVLQDDAEALKWWRLSAEQGNASAQDNLGFMYGQGNGVLQDYAEAVKWYRLSAEQGYANAQYNLGVMYTKGNGVLQDNLTAHMWYNIASANGSKEAGEYRDERAGLMTTDAIEKATAMAKECMNSNYILCGPVLSLDFTQVTAQDLNKGVDAALIAGDYTTGVKLWKLLAEQGDASAQLNLGFMYRNGNGVLKDATEAVKWFRLSAEQGFQHAQNNLGIQYENGEGVLQDYAEAVKWYRLSAEQGFAHAQYNLGVMYEKGNGVPKDNQTAHMWYDIAFANGHEKAGEWRDKLAGLMTADAIEKATAMARECMNSDYILCGAVLSLAFTQVTEQDLNKGVEAALIAGDNITLVKLFKLLAEQGFAYAQNNLGIQYEKGEGVLQDYAEAVKWYRLSAEQGNATAHYNLGDFYSDGEGVLQDNITSYMWFNIAFANGDDTADYFRDERAALMTASEITKATAMARECMKSDYKKCGQ